MKYTETQYGDGWLGDIDRQLESLRGIMRAKSAKALLVSQPHNLAWLLGFRVHIGISGNAAVCDLLLKDGGAVILANNIEAPRLRDLLGGALRVAEYPWHQTDARDANVFSMCPEGLLTDSECEPEIAALRRRLTASQKRELERVCEAASTVIEDCCLAVRPGMTDYEIAGMAAKGVYAAGLEPIVLLAACDDNHRRYRHPVPRGDTLNKSLMLSLGARGRGLHASITRFVSFGEPDAGFRKAVGCVHGAAAMLFRETRPGASLPELVNKLAGAYASGGFPGEIENHHQGGIGGFLLRELKATSLSAGTAEEDQVYCWNPSAGGFKSEDTMLVEANGNRFLTKTPRLPLAAESGLPDILIR